jgi:hypothetical protein
MVAIELACQKHSAIRLFHEDELELRSERQPFQWRVKIQNVGRLGVVPDRVFALEYRDQNGQNQCIHYFLEADRGTMPVVRSNLSQTSFRRKLLAYEGTWNQGIHRSRFGITRFRVLTVTTIPKRVQSLVEACSQLKSGQGLFLFADKSILSGDILSATWRTGRPDEVTSMLGCRENGNCTRTGSGGGKWNNPAGRPGSR